jgi:carboxypeptidase PM20D1
VETYLQPFGIEWTEHDHHLLVARVRAPRPERPPVLLLSHADVVPVPPEERPQWVHPPFAGVVDDGYVWGRGAVDMKSVTIMQLEALTDLLQREVRLSRDYLVAVVPDEEVGGRWGGRRLTGELWPQLGDLACVIDEGGFMLEDFLDGVRVAAVGLTEKSEAVFRLTARGPTGHASVPIERDAVSELIEALQRILRRQPVRHLHPVLAAGMRSVGRQASTATQAITGDYLLTRPLLLSFLARHPVTDALTRNTVTCTELAAGTGHNVRPGEATASLNVRVMPDEPAEEVLQRFRALVEDLDVDLSLMSAEPAVPVAPRDTYEYRILRRVLKSVFPDLAVASMVCPGTTESRFFARLGVPVYRFVPVEIRQDDPPGFHTANERISVENLTRGAWLYQQLFLHW